MIWKLVYLVRPGPASELPDPAIRGAYVACWVSAADEFAARRYSEWHLQNDDWEIEELVESDPFAPDEVPENDLQYYREAENEEASFVFHSWMTHE